jgi:hypothetical protein
LNVEAQQPLAVDADNFVPRQKETVKIKTNVKAGKDSSIVHAVMSPSLWKLT